MSRFRRAHSPDVEVMHLAHTRKVKKVSLNSLWTYSSGNGVQCQINRLAQQTPRSHRNHHSNNKTHGRSDPKPARNRDHESGNNYADANGCIGRHVNDAPISDS